MIKITGKSYIAGKWITPTGKSFRSVNPYTNESMMSFATCGETEIDQALTEAEHAYQTMRKLAGDAIGNFLNVLADEVEKLGNQLLEIGDSETALGIPRLIGERGRTCSQIRAFAELTIKGEWVQASIDTAIPDRVPIPKADLRRMMKAIGPVAVFGASNFPFAFGTLGGDTASAFAAGNPVIVKGHPAHPATSELFANAVDKAVKKTDMPEGIFSLLQGEGIDLGACLVKHPSIKAVGFTGSKKGGRSLMDIASARPEPITVYAEMGSINPVFVGPNTLKVQAKQIAGALSRSVCMGTGQFCTSPGILVSTENEVFETTLKQTLTDTPRGCLLNLGIAKKLQAGLKRLIDNPKVEWLNPSSFEDGSLTPPNAVFKVRAADFLVDDNLSEEVFGPVTLYVVCDDELQILEVAKCLKGNLSASIHCDEDKELAAEICAVLEQKVGRVIFNGYPTGVEVCPSQQHGGPYPASSISTATSVGTGAVVRFARFVAYQNTPNMFLPDALKNENPLGIYRLVNNELTKDQL